MENKDEIKEAIMELYIKNGTERGEVVRNYSSMPHYELLRPAGYIDDVRAQTASLFEFVLTDKAIALINEP